MYIVRTVHLYSKKYKDKGSYGTGEEASRPGWLGPEGKGENLLVLPMQVHSQKPLHTCVVVVDRR